MNATADTVKMALSHVLQLYGKGNDTNLPHFAVERRINSV